MGLKQDIIDKVKEIEAEKFIVEEVTTVPNINNSKLTFGCKGLKFKATVVYIDMRGSTAMLDKHQKRVVAKLHMSYYHAIVKVAKATGGKTRSFNGDSLLVFYEGDTKESLSNAVMSAMKMRYALSELVNNQLKNYTDIDFGIGVDYGEILATKVGLSGEADNKDLIWIGHCVNKSTKISDNCKSPNYVGISAIVYSNLQDNVKNHLEVDMWTPKTFTYNNKQESYYSTSYFFYIN